MARKSPEEEHPHKAFGWAARDSSGVLSPFHFSRRQISSSSFLLFHIFFILNFTFILL
jgi:hypothetical protein